MISRAMSVDAALFLSLFGVLFYGVGDGVGITAAQGRRAWEKRRVLLIFLWRFGVILGS